MVVGDQRHVLAVLIQGKIHTVPLYKIWVDPRVSLHGCGEKKIFCYHQGSNPEQPICKIFQSRHFEVCFTRQSNFLCFYLFASVDLMQYVSGNNDSFFFFFVMRGFSFSQQRCRTLKSSGIWRPVIWCMVLNVANVRNTFIFKVQVFQVE